MSMFIEDAACGYGRDCHRFLCSLFMPGFIIYFLSRLLALPHTARWHFTKTITYASRVPPPRAAPLKDISPRNAPNLAARQYTTALSLGTASLYIKVSKKIYALFSRHDYAAHDTQSFIGPMTHRHFSKEIFPQQPECHAAAFTAVFDFLHSLSTNWYVECFIELFMRC